MVTCRAISGFYENPSFTLEDAQLLICARDVEAQNLRTVGLAAGAVEFTAMALLVKRVVQTTDSDSPPTRSTKIFIGRSQPALTRLLA